MGSDEDQLLTWLALWARLQEHDEPPTGGGTPLSLDLATIYAVAGRLQHHHERAANAQGIACLVIMMLTYANYCANMTALHALLRKLCQVGFSRRFGPNISIPAASRHFPQIPAPCQNDHPPTRAKPSGR